MAQQANGVVYALDVTKLIGGTPVYVDVGGVYSVSSDGATVDLLDASVHADEWRHFLAGLKNPGGITLGIRFVANSSGHRSLLDSLGVLCAHRVTFPKTVPANTTPFSIASDGFVERTVINAPHDGLLDLSVTVKYSGAPAFVAEAA